MSITVILKGAEDRKDLPTGRYHVQAYCGIEYQGAIAQSGVGLSVLANPAHGCFVSVLGPCKPLRLWRSLKLLERAPLCIVTAGGILACLEAGHGEWQDMSSASKHLLARMCEGGLDAFYALYQAVHDEYPTGLEYGQLQAACALSGIPLDRGDDSAVQFFHISHGYIMTPASITQLPLPL